MNDFESGCVEDRAFESGVLVAADDESVQTFALPCGRGCFCSGGRFRSDLASLTSRVLVKLPDLAWRAGSCAKPNCEFLSAQPWYLLVHAAQFRGGQRVNFGDIH